jgi:hypothetical protein
MLTIDSIVSNLTIIRRKTNMKTIQINKEDAIGKTIDNHVNAQNATGNRREWQLHIFNGDNAKIVSHQDGNYYDSKVDVDVLGLDELFDENAINDIPSFGDDYSESRKDFMKDNDLESMDDLDEELQEKYDTLLDEYQSNTMDFAKSNLAGSTKDEVTSEAAEGIIINTYKIKWV